MPRLLLLAHRIPFPPDKGEKLRAYHFIAHLADRFDIRLGCLVDDPADWDGVGPCAGYAARWARSPSIAAASA